MKIRQSTLTRTVALWLFAIACLSAVPDARAATIVHHIEDPAGDARQIDDRGAGLFANDEAFDLILADLNATNDHLLFVLETAEPLPLNEFRGVVEGWVVDPGSPETWFQVWFEANSVTVASAPSRRPLECHECIVAQDGSTVTVIVPSEMLPVGADLRMLRSGDLLHRFRLSVGTALDLPLRIYTWRDSAYLGDALLVID